MKKLLAIVVLGLLSNNFVNADETLSILGIKLLDKIDNYKIQEDHGISEYSKSQRSYSVHAEVENEYFDNILVVETFGEDKIIYQINAYNSKLKDTDALQCQNLIVSILNKKSQDFKEKNYKRTFNKKKDGSLVSKYKTFKMIDASFIGNNNNFKFMSACDNRGKAGMDADADVWLSFKDDKIAEKVRVEYREFLQKDLNKFIKEENQKRTKGF